MPLVKYLLIDGIVGTQIGGGVLSGCAVAGGLGAVGAASWVDVKSM